MQWVAEAQLVQGLRAESQAWFDWLLFISFCVWSAPSSSEAKLYIPSTTNNWKKLLSTAIWADKNGLVFGRIACNSSNNLKSERTSSFYFYSIQFRMYFHPKTNSVEFMPKKWDWKWVEILLLCCPTIYKIIIPNLTVQPILFVERRSLSALNFTA